MASGRTHAKSLYSAQKAEMHDRRGTKTSNEKINNTEKLMEAEASTK